MTLLPEQMAEQENIKRRQSNEIVSDGVDKRPPTSVLEEESRKRGRRMMGVLLGTLKRFKTENGQESAEKQRQVQARLAERLQEEKAALAERMERERLELEKREAERAGERRLQEAAWASQVEQELAGERKERSRCMANYLSSTDMATGTKLYYLPAVLLPEQRLQVERQRALVEPPDDHDSYDDMSDA